MRANEALTFALRVLAGPAAFAAGAVQLGTMVSAGCAVRSSSGAILSSVSPHVSPDSHTRIGIITCGPLPVAAMPDLAMNRNDTVVLGALSVTIVMFLLGVGFGLLLGC